MYSHLMKPINIGSIHVRNRVVMSPLTTNYAEEKTGFVTDKMIEYYRARAKGGVGIVIVEGAIVRQDGRGFSKQLRVDSDDTIEGLSRLASTIKKGGSVAILQVMHHGRQTRSSISQYQPVAPSAVACPVYKETPRELSIEDIRELQQCFIKATKRAELAGFDGIEFHGAHGYLISGFLSSWSNMRDDQYGGSLENRTRFLTEIIQQVKKEVRDDFLILCRISANEFVDSGLETQEAIKIAEILEKSGVDVIDISAGVAPTFIKMSPPTGTIEAPYENVTEQIKQKLKIPVISVAKILSPEKADSMIKSNKTDFIALGRALVVDPDWVNKAMNNKRDDIIPCIGCNVCNGRSRNPEVICPFNPFTGNEYKWNFKKKRDKKNVAILGNGLEGYNLSILLTELGHNVTIFQDQQLPFGGLTALRAKIPIQSADLTKLLAYYERKLNQLQIEKKPLEKNLSFKDYDFIVETTVNINECNRITDLWHKEIVEKINRDSHLETNAIQVLNGKLPTTEEVLMVGGTLLGCEVATYLSQQGYKVTIIEKKERVPFDVTHSILQIIRSDLKKQSIEILKPELFEDTGGFKTYVWATNYPSPSSIGTSGSIQLGDSYKPDIMAVLMQEAVEIAYCRIRSHQ